MAKIAVEQSLTNVKEALEGKGYQVIPLKTHNDAQGCDCCVITGGDENVMGIQNVVTQGPVIDARGLNANQVCEAVDSQLR
ncbi:uncharacterized protein UPF0180 [Scopulibacillus darangshiensis]|uniref:UPF0180 protein EV207_10571 n=1 Tax=Scopulibacillus darangshiensis TaxID=442528 RepID=A0A4R2P6Q8_9BACL|nr:YkuS family protein [Scopulibacillus darangshiensis]TCP30542.1 uncharacterized protein UPF0180 [Scopulibacillus darangshiensis]